MRRLSSLLRYAGASTLLFSVAACSILGSEEDSSGLDDGATGGTGGSGGSSASAGAGAIIGTGGASAAGGTGGSDSAGAGDSGGTSGTDPGTCESLEGLGPQCGATSKQATFKTINVLIVLDKSGSMTDQPEGFDTDKWTATKDALGAALGEGELDINFGMLLYPNDLIRNIELACDGNCCAVPEGAPAVVVPIKEGPVAVPAIKDLLADTSPGGGTPTAAALQRAFLYFTEGEGAELEGENYVLLATDGGPNCNDNAACDGSTCTTNLDNQCDTDNCCEDFPAYCLDADSVTSQIQALDNAGVKTFVIGIPGTESYTTYLNEFADAGGVPQSGGDTSYYAVSADAGVQGLVDVFNSITTQLVRSCDIELTEQPPKLDDVNVAIDCDIVERGEDNENWDYDQVPNPTMIQLKGDVCTRLQNEGATRVDVVLGCPVVR
jgi:hypothetical protein